MAKPKTIITRMPPGPAIQTLIERTDAWVWEKDEPCPRELLLQHTAEVEGIFTMIPDKIDAELLGAAKNLKVVSTMAVGTDNIDVAWCTKHGIPVGYTPFAVTEATADLAMALVLAISRRIVPAANFCDAGKWKAWSPSLMISNDVFGKTLGIFGMGRIGQAVARRARGFDMPLLYHDVTRNSEAEQALGAKFRSFDQLLAESDILCIHAPLTPETHHIFNAETISKMKPSAFLVNAARGPLVDPKGLEQCLREGKIRGAAMDVTDPEPIEPDSPLLKMENCVIVPHMGTCTWETRALMTEITVNNLLNVLDGKDMVYCRNPEVLQKE